MRDYEARLTELGITIPELPSVAGTYVPAVKSGNLVFCSGQGPYQDESFAYLGPVEIEMIVEV